MLMVGFGILYMNMVILVLITSLHYFLVFVCSIFKRRCLKSTLIILRSLLKKQTEWKWAWEKWKGELVMKIYQFDVLETLSAFVTCGRQHGSPWLNFSFNYAYTSYNFYHLYFTIAWHIFVNVRTFRVNNESVISSQLFFKIRKGLHSNQI